MARDPIDKNNSPERARLNIPVLMLELARRRHAGEATMLAAQLERSLEQIIQMRMPNLSGRMRHTLFEGFGPLASFSSKIEVAYALGFIEATDKQSLHAIRGIRNKFAHCAEILDFDSVPIAILCKKLPPASVATTSNYHHFVISVEECASRLQAAVDIAE